MLFRLWDESGLLVLGLMVGNTFDFQHSAMMDGSAATLPDRLNAGGVTSCALEGGNIWACDGQEGTNGPCEM